MNNEKHNTRNGKGDGVMGGGGVELSGVLVREEEKIHHLWTVAVKVDDASEVILFLC